MNAPESVLRWASVPQIDDALTREVSDAWWPLARLAEGMEELARRAGLAPDAAGVLAVPRTIIQGNSEDLRRWIPWAAERLGMVAEAVETGVPDVPQLLRKAGPAVITYNDRRGPGFLLLLKARFGAPLLIGRNLKLRRISVESLRAILCWEQEAPLMPEIDRLLVVSQVPERRRPQVRAAMLRERLATERTGGCWLLRVPATGTFWRQLASAHLPHRVAGMLGIFAVLYTLEIMSWMFIGDAVFTGRFDMGWLAAWLLLMFSMIPLRLCGGWLSSTFALDAGRLLKSRLLAGALRMDLESVRRQGAGHLLGRVMESQALESLALNGGLGVLVACLELGFAAWVLSQGVAGAYHLILLAVWLALTAWLARRSFLRLSRWTLMRLELTHDLIERMVGHRTRLAQEQAARRDTHEDQNMKAYLETSRALDASVVPIAAGVPAGWMLIGLAALIPAFVAGGATNSGLAISLGGILLAQRALSGIAGGVAGLGRAAIAWHQVAALFHSARNGADGSRPFLSTGELSQGGARKLIDAAGLNFSYHAGGPRVLQDVDLEIRSGERVLLQGASGGGKSTLASLLAGLRRPDTGLLLLNGLDRHTLGDNWHQLATEAPQFQENHVLSGTLGFNLLMGREWPASEEDLREAEDLCEALGLGELLRRMPSGMMQRVGETGWQLSHGERSRIFLARALLQKARLTIMDESFAALDPETLEKCLACAMHNAETLVVIAHP